MHGEPSTRKRKHSVSDDSDVVYEESSTKKEKNLEISKRMRSETENNRNTKLLKTEKVDVKYENNSSQVSSSIKYTDKDVNGETSLKRKREDEIETEEEKNKNYIKIEAKLEEKADNETVFEKPKAKKVFRKRISKNECLCTPVENQPLQKPEDTEAHIQVEEWRLHKFQSPIELKHDESIHHDHFDPLEFHGHWDESGEATLTNNGFTATLRFYDKELPLLKGGPLHDDEYIFEQLHFHWSEDDHSGCEHIFEGRAFSMEAHAVHYNKKYKDFQEAQDKPDGLAVVAFFIQATDNEDNSCFNKLSNAMQDIIKINTTTNVPSDCLTWFKEEAQCKGYYTYQGSLTTEPYTESVTWILYPQPIHVSREQVASFRRLNSTPCEQHNIKQNVRPIQTPPEHKKLNVLYARSHRHSTSE